MPTDLVVIITLRQPQRDQEIQVREEGLDILIARI
jgi:hypothetical protein